jgi:hypothetical protein
VKTLAKNLVGLGVLAVVGAAVGGYAYLRAGEEDQRPKGKTQRLFAAVQVEPAAAARVELEKKGNVVVLVKDAGRWRIEKPVRMSADDDKVEALVRKLLELEATKVFGEDGAADPPTETLSGLQTPTARVAVDFAGAAPTKLAIVFGVDSGFDRSVYARSIVEGGPGAQQRTVQLAQGARGGFERAWTDLVDRRALGANAPEIVALRVVPGTPAEDRIEWAAARVPGGSSTTQEFAITAPFEGEADDNSVRHALEGMAAAPISEFVSEDRGADLASWGLDKPLWTVTATLQGKDGARVERVLRVAPGQQPKTLLIARDDQQWVGSVNEALDDGLDQTVGTLRGKDLLAFDREAVHRVELENGAARIVLERGGDRASDWRMLSPEPKVVKAYVANGLVFTFAELKAEAREADGDAMAAAMERTGLAKPSAKIDFFDGAGVKLGGLRFGATDGEDTFVMAEGGTFIGRVPTTRAAALPKTPADLMP